MRIFLYTLCDGAAHQRFDAVSDYQIDTIQHGLVSLGHEVVDYPVRWHMYKQIKEQNLANWNQIWGKGFTVTGLLDYDPGRIREDEIHHHKYDLVIIALHHTKANAYSEIIKSVQIVREQFKNVPIAILDGWDRTDISESVLNACKLYKATYFKREMDREITDWLKPIDFSMPEEKVQWKETDIRPNAFAKLIPVNQSINPEYMKTYGFETEEEYYKMYRQSLFGLTSKKGGWSTMRHFEIIANGSLPYFVDIENCPKNTLFKWPKDLLIEIKNLPGIVLNTTEEYKGKTILPHCGVIDMDNPGHISEPPFDGNKYNELRIKLMVEFYNNLTTKEMAQYLIDTCL
jgi:hypothetical protein